MASCKAVYDAMFELHNAIEEMKDKELAHTFSKLADKVEDTFCDFELQWDAHSVEHHGG